MAKVTRIKLQVKRDKVVLTSYGQNARGTKFSLKQLALPFGEHGEKPTVEELAAAVEKLRP